MYCLRYQMMGGMVNMTSNGHVPNNVKVRSNRRSRAQVCSGLPRWITPANQMLGGIASSPIQDDNAGQVGYVASAPEVDAVYIAWESNDTYCDSCSSSHRRSSDNFLGRLKCSRRVEALRNSDLRARPTINDSCYTRVSGCSGLCARL